MDADPQSVLEQLPAAPDPAVSPSPRVSRSRVAAAAIAAATLVAAVLWITSEPEVFEPEVSPGTVVTTAANDPGAVAKPPSGEPSDPVDTPSAGVDTPPAAGSQVPNPTTAVPPTRSGNRPDATDETAGRGPQTSPGSVPVPPRPATVRPPVDETGPVRTVVVPIDLAPIEQALAGGELARALGLLEGVANQTDERVRTLARQVSERSMDAMAVAETAANVDKAAELARTPFIAGAEAKTLAERAFERQEYVRAGRQALAAAASFRKASDDARLAADNARRAEDARRAAEESARKAAEEAARNAKRPEIPPDRKLDSAGILDVLDRFKAAYATRNVDAIRKVYPRLPEPERLRQFFNQCKDAYVTFSSVQPSLVPDDPTAAFVSLRSTYVCQPRIKAPVLERFQDDVFRLRRVGDVWLIERMGALDPQR
jgi:hypothetical protein